MNSDQRRSPDFATLAGGVIALLSILGGLILEGGSVRDIAQVTAALMVVGGTLGAVFVSTPLHTLLAAARSLRLLFFDRVQPLEQTLDTIVRLSMKARKTGIGSLEPDAIAMEDTFFGKGLNLLVDNTPLEQVRGMLELELDLEECRLDSEAKVFETAGGYAPTVGIIGAVLGLIQVMKHLENIDDVGRGIAVAFVATIYGVALANLILLPAAAKLRFRAARIVQLRELTLEGIAGISEAMNTSLLRMKLEPYLSTSKPARRVKPVAHPRPEPSAA